MNDGPERRLTCPACRRYIGTVDGQYYEAPPCRCGVQTTVRIGRRALDMRDVAVVKEQVANLE